METSNKPGAKQLTPLDWLMPRYYMPQIYCFPSSNSRLRQSLQDGLSGLVTDIPFLLSGVVSQKQPLGSVALGDPYRSVSDCFTWQDLSSELDYNSLKKDHFPLPVFNEHDIIVPNTLKRPLPVPAPVFWARLTLVRGGAFLYVGLHHSVADMTGFGSIVKLWASYCRTGSSSAAGFDPSWLDRSAFCNLASSIPIGINQGNIPGGLFYDDYLMPAAQAPCKPPQDRQFTTAIFHFAPGALEQLKIAANAEISALEDAGLPWVSTNDVLTALLWSAVVCAEYDTSSTSDSDDVSHMALPVNFRSRWNPPLPNDYLGAACARASVISSKRDLLQLASAPWIGRTSKRDHDGFFEPKSARLLAKVSIAVRRAIMGVDVDELRRAIAFTASQSDLSRITQQPIQALMITSWADQGACELDWGNVVGRCDAVRFATFPTKVRPIILPRLHDGEGGGLEVLVSLNQEEIKRFRESALVKQFGSLRTSVFLGNQ
ncbi:trichothecene 3-o-acetyltransferase [Colletotrichum incanum]|uniref:Trichothecene 3-o-acetyltransferase n=1 Tax=Colletotrichum incanum TaxID=1573173 RepID=A0A167AXS8_COLIC|nr:trichothecene 3-o-acetyltransferase [Colletotrichum incanum]